MYYIKSTVGLYATNKSATKQKSEASIFKNKHDAEKRLGEIWNRLPLEGHWEIIKEDDPPEELLSMEARLEKWLHTQGDITQHDYIKMSEHLLDVLKIKNPNIEDRIEHAKIALYEIDN